MFLLQRRAGRSFHVLPLQTQDLRRIKAMVSEGKGVFFLFCFLIIKNYSGRHYDFDMATRWLKMEDSST